MVSLRCAQHPLTSELIRIIAEEKLNFVASFSYDPVFTNTQLVQDLNPDEKLPEDIKQNFVQRADGSTIQWFEHISFTTRETLDLKWFVACNFGSICMARQLFGVSELRVLVKISEEREVDNRGQLGNHIPILSEELTKANWR